MNGFALLAALIAAFVGMTIAGTATMDGRKQGGGPRKVVVGTALYPVYEFKGQERRIQDIEGLIDEMAKAAKSQYSEDGLDLVVLPEEALTLGSGRSPAERAVRLDGPEVERIRRKARQHKTYIVTPLTLAEGGIYTNSAALLDREGEVAGLYRKVHPVAPLDSDVLEGGITPGTEFPVFQCDFGTVGIQICFDLAYEDGWEALARKGAEIVALPSASPQTVRPAAYAVKGRYFVVSSTPKGNATVFNPVGRVSAQITKPSVLVHRIDLSYALLHWSPTLGNGKAFAQRYGERAGFVYYDDEDTGMFWSNDPAVPIGRMLKETGEVDMVDHVKRVGKLQKAARRAAGSRRGR